MAAQPPIVHVTGVIFDIRTLLDSAASSGTTGDVGSAGSGKGGEAEGSRLAGGADGGGGGGGGSGGKSSGGAEAGAAAEGRIEGGVVKVPGRTIRTLCRLHYSGVHMGVLLYASHRDSLEQQFLSLQASLAADKATAPLASLVSPIFLPLAATTPASSPATPPPLSLLWDPSSSSCCDPHSPAAAPSFPPTTTLVVLGGEAAEEVRVLAGPTAATLTSSPSSSPRCSPLQWHHSALQGEAVLPDLELVPPLLPQLSQQVSRIQAGRACARVNVLSAEPTDEIVQVDASMDGVHLTFSPPFQHLLDYCSSSSGSLKIVDPLPAVLPLTDRVKTLSLLSDLLSTIDAPGSAPPSAVLRVPRFVQVPDIRQTAAVLAAMAAAGVRLPVIVKPRIACGAAASHAMAIVFSEDAFATLSLPSPSVIQEYVDHGACQFKCYVLGDAFFAAERRSTPDAAPLLLQQQKQAHGEDGQQQQQQEEQRAKASAAPAAISFDSLKSLPMAFPSQPSEQQQQQAPLPQPVNPSGAARQGGNPPALGAVGGFNEAVARRAADLLRSALGLTLFGFDVLVQEGTGEHVVVDVNHFPSFKDVPDHISIPFEVRSKVTASSCCFATTVAPHQVQEGTAEHVVVDVNYFPSFKDVPDHLAIPAFHTACASRLV
ncbi:unnamed protein product [Closterium sp. NIES-64]|nr:unnamed protein product [Closterium sp. NIES-64]